jgi:flagellar biosynthesis anti-sigma factor FlgM
MRIDLNSNFLPAENAASVNSTSRASDSAANNQLSNDSAELSQGQLSATSLAAAANQLPEVRQEKVAALASQLSAGTYQVSAAQTADAIVSYMQLDEAA